MCWSQRSHPASRTVKVRTYRIFQASHGLGSTEFHVLRARSTISDRYLYHLTRTSHFRLRGEGMMSGSAGQRRVPTEFFGRYAVRMPSLEEQRRIAEILDTIDETIRATERVIAKLMDVEQGLRRDLLDRKFKCARPEDWKHCRIGDFADVQRGASPRPIRQPCLVRTRWPRLDPDLGRHSRR